MPPSSADSAAAVGPQAWAELARSRTTPLPARARAQPRAEAALRRVLRALRRALRRAAGRLRARDDDRRGADVFEPLKAQLVPLIAAVALGGRATTGSCTARSRSSGSRRRPRHHRAVGYDRSRGGSTPPSTRSRPARALRTSGSPRATPSTTYIVFAAIHECGHGLYEHGFAELDARRSAAASPRPSTSRRAGSGRTSSAAAGRSGAVSPRRCGTRSPRRSARRRGALLPGGQPGAAVAHPGRGGRGDVQPPRDPPLRARAGAVAGRIALADLPEAWNARIEEYLGIEVPATPTACSRTSTGRAASRLLPHLRARQRHVGADLGEARRPLRTHDQIEPGEFGELRDWLREHLYRTAASSRPRRRSSACRGRDRRRAVPRLPAREAGSAGGGLARVGACDRALLDEAAVQDQKQDRAGERKEEAREDLASGELLALGRGRIDDTREGRGEAAEDRAEDPEQDRLPDRAACPGPERRSARPPPRSGRR